MRKKAIFVIVLFFIVLFILCAFLYKPMSLLLCDIENMKTLFCTHGIIGRVCIVLCMALQVVLIFLPGEIIEVFAGAMYGTMEGLLLCMIGVFIGSYFIFMLVKKYGTFVVRTMLHKKDMEEMYFLEKYENIYAILFILYFIPGTPKDILTYFIPLTNMSFSAFICITTYARIPSIITSTIGGNALGLKQYEISIYTFLITLCISIIGLIGYKKLIKKS